MLNLLCCITAVAIDSFKTLMSHKAQARKDEKGVGCILFRYG